QLRSTTSRPFSSRSATDRPPNLEFLLHPKRAMAFSSTATEILCGSADRECWARYRALICKPRTTIKKKRRCRLHGGARGGGATRGEEDGQYRHAADNHSLGLFPSPRKAAAAITMTRPSGARPRTCAGLRLLRCISTDSLASSAAAAMLMRS